MLKRPLFWIVFALLALAGAGYAVRFFPEAFPILSVDLKMDRTAALRAAHGLAEKYRIGPMGFRETAVFQDDSEVQNYVELEGGGKPAFRAMVEGDKYAPFEWIVRHYREGMKAETSFFFTPQGAPYGFIETVPETEPGAALSADAALALAQTAATRDWGVDFKPYNPPDRSQEVRPSGRVDHTFVYERPEKIGEGRYQLTLAVSGDRLTEVNYSVKVPEGFTRRYADMRSANTAIYTAASSAAAVLYVIGGCFIGLFFLLRQRWVLWRGALAAGALVAFLQVLAGLNGLPLRWMEYDTALSPTSFMLTAVVVPSIRLFLQETLLLSLSFLAAESLTRRAFPHHLQIWKLWRPEVAASPELLGRTVMGYLVVGLDLAFLVTFYIVTGRYFGWWSPSEALIDPNLPANYFPWFNPIAEAMHAGTWEESMFRAIPLASAALIGDWLQRRGRRNARFWCIAVAFVVQILVFGGGHATYPVQPAYGRMIELIVPSIIFATLYLRFGLLPAMIAHFFFDVLMMSLPILTSSLPGVWVDRGCVALFALLPLWVVLAARLRRNAAPVDPAFRNVAWHPAPPAPEAAATVLDTARPPGRRVVLGACVAGALGLALWIGCAGFRNEAPPLRVTRAEAVLHARQALADRKVVLGPEWSVLSAVGAPRGESDAFVWRSGTPADYALVLRRFLQPPYWQVRFVRFTGDVARRAEEYRVKIARDGEVLEFTHDLPEAAPGATLDAAAAQALAAGVLQAQLDAPAAGLREMAVQPTKQPQRLDWTLAYAETDPARYPLKVGQGRYFVSVAGGEVRDARGYVFVPDAWKRKEVERLAPLQAFETLCQNLLLVGMAGALAAAIVAWSAGRFSARAFFLFFFGVLAVRAVEIANGWPALLAGFDTSQPIASQAFAHLGATVRQFLFGAISIGAAAGYFQAKGRHPRIEAPHARAAGIAFALALAWVGVRAATGRLVNLDPPWASYADLNGAVPWLGAALARSVDILYTTAEFFWLFRLADLAASRNRNLAAGAIVVVGTLVYLGGGAIDGLGAWLAAGVASGLVLAVGYFAFLREHRAWLPFVFGVIGAFGALKQALLHAHPAWWGHALAAVMLIATGWLWSRRLAAAR
jgi:hypothetical protein